MVFAAIFPTSAKTGDGLHEAFDWLSDIISYGKATETVKSIGASATQTVTDNKTVTIGWNYTVCGINKMRDWLWGTSKPPLEATSVGA